MKPPLSNGTAIEKDAETQQAGTDKSTSRLLPNGSPHLHAKLDSAANDHHIEPRHRTTNPILNNLIFLVMGSLLTYAANFISQQPDLPAIQLQPPPTIAPTALPQPTATPEPFTIFISGAVQNPGLYEVNHQARVGDALLLAGGLLTDADASIINQAERLFDGAQIHVPVLIQVDDIAQVSEGGGETAIQPTAPLLLNQPPAGISGSSISAPLLSNSGNPSLIDVNTATAAELETLPGVGASRAAEIVAGRPYATVDELQKVSGIGAKTVEKLRPLVTVD